MLQESEDQKNQCCVNRTLSWHKSGLICLKQWDYWATPAVDVSLYFYATGEVTLCYILNCIQCIYWWHVCPQNQSFPAGQAAFWAEKAGSRLGEDRVVCPSHRELGSTCFQVDKGKQRHAAVFALTLFPVCTWGVSGKKGREKSLTEVHKCHHYLLRPMKEKGWCLYWWSWYLSLTTPPSYDCICALYTMEDELWQFSENNANESGLVPKVTLGKSRGRKLINCFRALCIALWPSADRPVPGMMKTNKNRVLSICLICPFLKQDEYCQLDIWDMLSLIFW